MKRSLLLAVGVVAALALAAPASLAAGKQVTIKGSYGSYNFSPKNVTIKKGKTVTWSWSSDAKHNVTFPKRHSQTKRTIGSYKLTFNKAGTFHYSCTVHGFAGKVVVTAP
jgi:plastocyanin